MEEDYKEEEKNNDILCLGVLKILLLTKEMQELHRISQKTSTRWPFRKTLVTLLELNISIFCRIKEVAYFESNLHILFCFSVSKLL